VALSCGYVLILTPVALNQYSRSALSQSLLISVLRTPPPSVCLLAPWPAVLCRPPPRALPALPRPLCLTGAPGRSRTRRPTMPPRSSARTARGQRTGMQAGTSSRMQLTWALGFTSCCRSVALPCRQHPGSAGCRLDPALPRVPFPAALPRRGRLVREAEHQHEVFHRQRRGWRRGRGRGAHGGGLHTRQSEGALPGMQQPGDVLLHHADEIGR